MSSTFNALSLDQKLNNALNSIGWYAKEHNLTSEQVRRIFDAGLVAAKVLDYVDIPTVKERT